MINKPNIILIMTDQQRYDTIASLGASYVETPNIDRLVKTGVQFSKCFITGASCVPSRASVFTGLYPHSSGVLKNGDKWSKGWIAQLRSAGYHTVNIGKMHTVPYDEKAGFDERFIVENKDRYLDGRWFFDEWDKALASHGFVKPQRELYRKRADYKERLGAFQWDLPPALHSDNFVGGMANWWLNTKPVKKPLFLQIGFPGPHPPYDPTPDILAKYLKKTDIPMPVIGQDELENLPPPLKVKRNHDAEVDHDSILWPLDANENQIKYMRAHYMANVEMIDLQIGKIMDTLQTKGYLDNAIVIFTTDHGDCLGDHGLTQKWSMYEEVVHVPLIINSQSHFKGGRTIDAMVQLHDLAPTILEWAGVEQAYSMEAHSLNQALLGDEFLGREYVFCEQAGDHNLTGCEFVTMIRSKDIKLVHFKGETYGQLFDLRVDPHEHKNLWDDVSYSSIKSQLSDVLLNWLIESNYKTRDTYAQAR